MAKQASFHPPPWSGRKSPWCWEIRDPSKRIGGPETEVAFDAVQGTLHYCGFGPLIRIDRVRRAARRMGREAPSQRRAGVARRSVPRRELEGRCMLARERWVVAGGQHHCGEVLSYKLLVVGKQAEATSSGRVDAFHRPTGLREKKTWPTCGRSLLLTLPGYIYEEPAPGMYCKLLPGCPATATRVW